MDNSKKSNKKLIDPNLAQEQEKYANPVPSREFILQVMREYNAPISRPELFELLQIDDEERQEGLRRRLRAMENAGQVIFTKGKRFVLPEKLDLLKGEVIGHRDGYGFLQVEGSNKDLFIPSHQMRNCIHGDIVLAQINGFDRKGRQEVRIVRILEARDKLIIGRFFIENNQGFVVPDDSRLQQDILIPSDAKKGARMGQVVVVKLLPRGGHLVRLIGEVTEVLGDNMAKGMETEIALRRYEIPHQFSKAVINQCAKWGEFVPEEAKQNRVDLRGLPLVTIDGEDARDFDDAVFAEAEKGGWRLWVAIADVSYYVRQHSSLDKEAYNRGNSVYFPNRVVPMLPEILSNGLCSLNPQVDRLCMVCEIAINKKGKIENYKFYEAVMNSHARLTYTKVSKILNDNDPELCERYQALVPHLQELHNLFQALLQARHRRGTIDFETIESKFVFNEIGRIESIEPVIRNDAHKIIEECMIAANICAANFVETRKEPALYRIHAKPSEEKLAAFRSFLGEFGLNLNGGEEPATADYAKLLREIKDRPDYELIQTVLLRSLSQAVYSGDNEGHFGLALSEYAHFTSPIRRYPDLLLHRAIKYSLAKGKGLKRKTTDTGGYHYNMAEIDSLGEHCSMTERRADEATRDVADWLKCEFMQDHIGEEFTGVISTVTGFGLFVRLDDLFIDGLVHISTLKNEYYQFDQTAQRLIGEHTGTVYRLGDKVKIKVMSVNLDSRQIDFELIESQYKARGKGKTAKKRFKEAPKSTGKITTAKFKKKAKNATAKVKISEKKEEKKKKK